METASLLGSPAGSRTMGEVVLGIIFTSSEVVDEVVDGGMDGSGLTLPCNAHLVSKCPVAHLSYLHWHASFLNCNLDLNVHQCQGVCVHDYDQRAQAVFICLQKPVHATHWNFNPSN